MNLGSLRRWLAWLRCTPLHPQWLLDSQQSIARWAEPSLHGSVLDIGCGDRWIEPHLANGAFYVGLDSIATGARLYQSRPSMFGDAPALGIRDGCVDCVLLLEVLEHLESPRSALREIHRVLRPGGRLLLSMPFLYPIHDAPHDFQRYTTYGLAREMAAVGLVVRSIVPTRHALEAAGLLGAIACGAVAVAAVERRSPAMLLLPLLVATIPVINCLAWIGARLLPDWSALTSGYRVIAEKPQ